jgi:hypothetical protein
MCIYIYIYKHTQLSMNFEVCQNINSKIYKKKFLFTKITHTRTEQNFEVMSNNLQLQETYSKLQAVVTSYHAYLLYSSWLSMQSRDDITKYVLTERLTAY